MINDSRDTLHANKGRRNKIDQMDQEIPDLNASMNIQVMIDKTILE
jgi:hypothetical protein